MQESYDFSGASKNPYAAALKEAVTLSLDKDVLAYFRQRSEETGVPYETLINWGLANCMDNGWKPGSGEQR